MSRRVVITGAGGFVGAALVRAFAQNGDTVTAIDRQFDPGALPPDVVKVKAPLEDALAGLNGAADFLIHCAAITASPKDLSLTAADHIAENTKSLLAALSWARSNGCTQFLFLSSTGVFASHDATVALTEDTPPSGLSAYAAAKRAGETLTAGAAEPGFETLSLRLGYLFGPEERARPSRPGLSLATRMIAEAQTQGVISSGQNGARRDWTYLPDLASAIAKLPENWPDHALIHAGRPPVYDDDELASAITTLLPGARVAFRQENVPTKPPMSSICDGLFSNMHHTPLPRALAACLQQVPVQ